MESAQKKNYPSTLEGNNASPEEESVMRDILRAATEAREEVHVIMQPMQHKIKHLGVFMHMLQKPKNEQVAWTFLVATAAMFTVPILVLVVGMHLVAPFFEADAGVCGGLLAVLSTVVIMTTYVVHAFLEPDERVINERLGEAKKDQ